MIVWFKCETQRVSYWTVGLVGGGPWMGVNRKK